MDLWKQYELAVGTTYHWQLGLLDLWVERADREWRVAHRTRREEPSASQESDGRHASAGPTIAEESVKPDDLSWRRVAVSNDAVKLRLSPVMPDRPLVVRPESPFVLPHGVDASLIVSIPVWVRLSVGSKDVIDIAEVPTVTLSNTWFGDPASGELCYSLSTRARRSLGDEGVPVHRAACPVAIKNASTRDLQFARLCVHAGSLALFAAKAHLVTSTVEVTYQAEEQQTRTRFGSAPPSRHDGAVLLSPPRMPRKENVFSRGLSTIRSLTGL